MPDLITLSDGSVLDVSAHPLPAGGEDDGAAFDPFVTSLDPPSSLTLSMEGMRVRIDVTADPNLDVEWRYQLLATTVDGGTIRADQADEFGARVAFHGPVGAGSTQSITARTVGTYGKSSWVSASITVPEAEPE